MKVKQTIVRAVYTGRAGKKYLNLDFDGGVRPYQAIRKFCAIVFATTGWRAYQLSKIDVMFIYDNGRKEFKKRGGL